MSVEGTPTGSDGDPPYREFHDIATQTDTDFRARLTDVLALCCSYLDTDYGYLTRIDDDLQEVTYIHGDHDLLNADRAWPLSISYCQCALDNDGPFEVTATTDTDQLDDRGLDLFGLQTYLGTPLYVGDDLYGTLCFAADAARETAFTPAEKQFFEDVAHWANRELSYAAARRELAAETDRLEQYLRTIGHDLQNPLMVAQFYLDELAADADDDRLQNALAAVERSQTLLEDLLALATQRRPTTTIEAVSLAATAEAAWETSRTGAGQLVVTDDVTVAADPSRLQQLLANLLSNAVEHGGDDVTVEVGPLADGFYVADDGPGFDVDPGELFAPGYSTDSEGSGLGLSIVTEIVDAHDWHITATDMDGARFEITGVGTETGDATQERSGTQTE